MGLERPAAHTFLFALSVILARIAPRQQIPRSVRRARVATRFFLSFCEVRQNSIRTEDNRRGAVRRFGRLPRASRCSAAGSVDHILTRTWVASRKAEKSRWSYQRFVDIQIPPDGAEGHGSLRTTSMASSSVSRRPDAGSPWPHDAQHAAAGRPDAGGPTLANFGIVLTGRLGLRNELCAPSVMPFEP